MTFQADETGIATSAPVELYEFRGPNVSQRYRYTSSLEDITFDGNLYTAVPLERSTITQEGLETPPEITIKLPWWTGVVKDFGFSVAPNRLDLVITRAQANGDAVVWLTGLVQAIEVNNEEAIIHVPPTKSDAFQQSVPNIIYQTMCNHMLYDPRCGLDRGSFAESTTVDSVDGVNVVVTATTQPDQAYQGGELFRSSDSERRMIVSQIGTALTLAYPFPVLAVSDAVVLVLGCNHSIKACKEKFNNVINFGGHPYIPPQNIFQTDFSLGGGN